MPLLFTPPLAAIDYYCLQYFAMLIDYATDIYDIDEELRYHVYTLITIFRHILIRHTLRHFHCYAFLIFSPRDGAIRFRDAIRRERPR